MLLGRGVRFDRALDEGEALRSELHEDAAAVVRIGAPANEARLLEPVDTMGDGRGRQKEGPGELGGAHPIGVAGPAQYAENVELVRVEPELVEDVLDRALDVPGAPAQALYHGLGPRVEIGALALPLLEREIDVILLGNNESLTWR